MTLTSAFKSKLKSRECCTFFDLQNFYNIKLNNVVKTTRTSVFLQHYGHKAKVAPIFRTPYTNAGINDIIPVIMEENEMSQYTSQFKTEVAKAALKSKTYAEVSKKYGVDRTNVRKWADAYEKYGALAFEDNGPEIFQQQRIRDLERQIAELQEENEILKKATAFFSKRSL